jgi:uncharacterized membrane protein YdbT with pleckstrin-like domain
MSTSTTSTSSGGGIGFVGLLTIVFITLKLTGFIDWSWWWVLAPIWISGLLLVAVMLVVAMVVVLWILVSKPRYPRGR